MVVLCSAGGVIALLEEESPKMKVYALHKLNGLVDTFWHEIAEVVSSIEVLVEDSSFPERKLAALVASKVYYHLSCYDNALLYALGAEELFNINLHNEYVTTVITRALDLYSAGRSENAQLLAPFELKGLTKALEDLVNRVFEDCFQRGEYKEIVGIALETKRLDMLYRALSETKNTAELTNYTLKAVIAFVQKRNFRNEILSEMIHRLGVNKDVDYGSVCQALKYLEEPICVADILCKLVEASDDAAALAYQLAIDLYDTSQQLFTRGVLEQLKAKTKTIFGEKTETTSEDAATVATAAESTVKNEPVDPSLERLRIHYANLKTILSGSVHSECLLQFTIKNNHTDMLILKTIKESVRNSTCHSATVIANAIMHCGTTNDEFLRTNLEWVGKANNWAKFSAVASLGVIHKGHESQAMRVLENYLPKESTNNPSYLEGGGLYALGLIFAGKCATDVVDYLVKQMQSSSSHILRHGACLAVGLVALGTHRLDLYESLKNTLYQDDAVSGEAAALAMGLVMAGSNNLNCVRDLKAYAMETRHEKILRGLCVGLAVIACGRLEEPEPWINDLLQNKNPLIRRAGVHALAMAYYGTGNSVIAGRLLNISVSDVNDDVRRAAVSCLGFLMLRNRSECVSLVSQLTESYNPHVRYGAAMALGIACAGTGNAEALSILEPMMEDPMNFVRQAAFIALGMVYMQTNEVTMLSVKEFRSHLLKTVADKHEDSIAKFGAILGQGILDAGGRNVTLGLMSKNNDYVSMTSAVGLMVFMQIWYWFPMSFFLSLALRPTCLIGINTRLQMPKIDFVSNGILALYSYPAPMEEKRTKMVEKVATAVLSFRTKRRERDIKATKQIEKEEKIEENEPKEDMEKSAAVDQEITPGCRTLENPTRVLYSQLKTMSMPEGSRYRPVKSLSCGGIIVMRDSNSEEVETLVEMVKPVIDDDDSNEPPAPEPFEYNEP